MMWERIERQLVSEPSGRAVIERYIELMNRNEFSRLNEVLHPDCVEELPQSGERFRGLAAIRATRENYPGELQAQRIRQLNLTGGQERWAVTPNFTTVRITGEDDRFSYVLTTTYPDGSDWHLIAFVDLRDGLIAKATVYFAPTFPAPDWRAPYREPLES